MVRKHENDGSIYPMACFCIHAVDAMIDDAAANANNRVTWWHDDDGTMTAVRRQLDFNGWSAVIVLTHLFVLIRMNMLWMKCSLSTWKISSVYCNLT